MTPRTQHGRLSWLVGVLACTLGVLLPGAAVRAQTAGGSAGGWQPGPDASGPSTLTGFVDAPAAGATLPSNRILHMSGWVADSAAQDSSGVDDVKVYLGTMDSGTFLGEAPPTDPRPDVAAVSGNPAWTNVGWSLPLDTGLLGAGANLLNVYAHTPSRGWWFTQLSVTLASALPSTAPPSITITAPTSDQKISTSLGSFLISGSVSDPASGSPSTIDVMEVWLNGEKDDPNASFLGNPDVQHDGTWLLGFNPTNWRPLGTNLYVYAHSDLTFKTSVQVVHFYLFKIP